MVNYSTGKVGRSSSFFAFNFRHLFSIVLLLLPSVPSLAASSSSSFYYDEGDLFNADD